MVFGGLKNRLRRKTEPNSHLDRLYSGWDGGIQVGFTVECWDDLPKKEKRKIIEWAKANLWKNRNAYFLLKDLVHNGD